MSTQGLDHIDGRLRHDVRRLGFLLGDVIAKDQGQAALDSIEQVRALAKQARASQPTGQTAKEADWSALSSFLSSQDDSTLVTIARAFNQFLNLANIAEQAHAARLPATQLQLKGDSATAQAVAELAIELVLTAHPTEVLRRTMIQKYDAIEESLSLEESPDNSDQLNRLIAESWHSDEIRETRPTPQDEAKWGFAVIESSLWSALPAAVRDLDQALSDNELNLSLIHI